MSRPTNGPEAIFAFATTFRVMMADRALAAAGIAHGLSPTPKGIASPCGLCLRVPLPHAAAAHGAIVAAPVAFDGIYREVGGAWAPFDPNAGP